MNPQLTWDCMPAELLLFSELQFLGQCDNVGSLMPSMREIHYTVIQMEGALGRGNIAVTRHLLGETLDNHTMVNQQEARVGTCQ